MVAAVGGVGAIGVALHLVRLDEAMGQAEIAPRSSRRRPGGSPDRRGRRRSQRGVRLRAPDAPPRRGSSSRRPRRRRSSRGPPTRSRAKSAACFAARSGERLGEVDAESEEANERAASGVELGRVEVTNGERQGQASRTARAYHGPRVTAGPCQAGFDARRAAASAIGEPATVVSRFPLRDSRGGTRGFMGKLRVGLLFGGRSVEHDVSIVSATSILHGPRSARATTCP